MKELKNIMVDDIRGNPEDYYQLFRDSPSATNYFRKLDNLDLSDIYLFMDNDLGKESIEGKKILDEIFEARKPECFPSKVMIVSSNTPAVEYMQQTLQKYNYISSPNGRVWSKNNEDN